MTKLQSSVRQWILSVLAVDLLFWILIGANCLFDSVSCFENAMFGSWAYYQPFVNIPFPWLSPTAITEPALFNSVALITLVATHAALGCVLGLLFQKKQFTYVLSFVTSLAIIFVLAFGFTRQQMEDEIERETDTQLWSVYEIDEAGVTFKVAEWQDDMDVNTPFYVEEEGEIWQALENTDQTVVKVLCMSDRCNQEEDGYDVMTFDEYLAARRACIEAPIDCAYYSIHTTPDLFDVTFNPTGIVIMQERYLP
jgi:hypothetical protein